MTRQILASVLSVSILSAVPVLVGCDETVSHKETTKTNADGTGSHTESTVKKQADGTVVKEEKKSVDNTVNP